MTAIEAWIEGWRRVWRAPALVLGMLAASLAFALPLALVLRGMIAGHLGPSLAAEAALRGVNWDWWQEFAAQATGLGATFAPSVIGFAAPIANVSDLLDNRRMATVVAAVVGVWLVLWSFLAGGMIDRLARDRRLGVAGFAAAAGRHAGRLWRLGVLALGLYALLFGYVHGWLFDDLFRWATREFTVERTAFLVRVGLYLAFGVLLVALNIVTDYARIRLVVEDRHSAVMALVAGARFVRRRPGPVVLLYLLNGFGFLLLLRVYAAVAPGASPSGVGFWLGVLLSQAYVAGRVLVKLQFYASQVTYFQGQLAHAGYVAAPLAVPGDSAAAEALRGAPVEPIPTRG